MKQSMWRTTTAWVARVLVFAAVALVVMTLAGGNGRPADAQGSVDTSVQAEAATGNEVVQVSSSVSGQRVQVQVSAQPPVLSPERVQARDNLMSKSFRPGPEGPVAPIPNTAPAGPADKAIASQNQPAAAGSMVVYRNSVLPSYNPQGPQPNYSYTMEPSTGNNGKNVFQTGNWYASFSKDNGASWSFVDPYSLGGSWSFCCDQVTLYDPGRNIQLWLLQGDHLRLGVSSGTDLVNWCAYNLTAANFGQPSTTEIDYNDMNITENYLYITSNLFPAAGGKGAGLIRLPLNNLANCSTVGIGTVAWVPGGSHGWSFTWKLIEGAGNVMYWASDWNSNLTSGSKMRIFSLADNTSTYYWYDRTIAAFAFFTRASGQDCSATGVTNWCQFNDSRVKGGALARNALYFAVDVKQGGAFTHPHIRVYKFNVTGVAAAGYTDKWANWGSLQYPSLSPNARGELAMAYSVGGLFSNGTSMYPSSAVALQDDFGVFSNSILYTVFGQGNTCKYGGLYRWGDYNTVRPFWPVGDVWIAGAWAVKGTNCGSTDSYVEAHNVVFGRGRDGGSYYRWDNY